jgi:hypothetical protein
MPGYTQTCIKLETDVNKQTNTCLKMAATADSLVTVPYNPDIPICGLEDHKMKFII